MPHRLRCSGCWPPGCSHWPSRPNLIAYRDGLNSAKIGREIADLQNRLLILAKEKTEQLYLATLPTALPDLRKGIRIRAS